MELALTLEKQQVLVLVVAITPIQAHSRTL